MFRQQIARWRESRAESEHYRRLLRDHVRGQVRHSAKRHGLGSALVLSVCGVAAYVLWGEVRDVIVDPLGLLFAAVAPTVAWTAGSWIWHRMQGPRSLAISFINLYCGQPLCPFTAASRQTYDGIRFTLALSKRHSSTELSVSSALCLVSLPQHHQAKSKQLGPTNVSDESETVLIYPDDFTNAQWPLDRGRYEAQWHVDFQGKQWTFGHQFKVTK